MAYDMQVSGLKQNFCHSLDVKYKVIINFAQQQN